MNTKKIEKLLLVLLFSPAILIFLVCLRAYILTWLVLWETRDLIIATHIVGGDDTLGGLTMAVFIIYTVISTLAGVVYLMGKNS